VVVCVYMELNYVLRSSAGEFQAYRYDDSDQFSVYC
jgi:hypothetical protein